MSDTEHNGKVDFAAELSNAVGGIHTLEAQIVSYGQRMYSLGLAAAGKPVDAPDFAAIRERCEKATAPPWKHGGRDTPEIHSVFSPAHTVSADSLILAYVEEGRVNSEADFDFIAHARSDIPLLLDALAAAQASQAAAYRAGLEAGAECLTNKAGRYEVVDNVLFSLAQAILALDVPEKFGGGK